jgi:8-amino-3,8-dideoxy-alpha-D-manno-octulosonate transaminase
MSNGTIPYQTEDSTLAIEGGTPVRTRPLPSESPGIHWFGEQEIELVTQVIHARSPFRYYGPNVQHMCDRLEDEFRKLYGVKHALAVSSGTEAIYTCLAAMDVGPGDEVLLPGYLWTSCINGIVRLGAIPRLVDIDETFDMSPDDLERKIGPHSKAVLYVHMSGAAGDIETIVDIARRHNLLVLEDCAQANGATLKGRPVGTFGDIGILSFQLNKSITAGEGGMIFCNDDNLYKRCFGIHDLGYARDNVGVLMDTSCEERYHLWGCGARMSELTGAFLLGQVSKLHSINDAMRTAKWRIRRQLEGIEGLKFRRIVDPQGDSGAFLIYLFEDGELGQRFTNALRAEGMRGEGYAKPCISMREWGLHWYFNNKSLVNRKSLHSGGWPWTFAQNAFASSYTYGKGTLPVCDDYADRAGLLKVSSALTEADIQDIITAYQKVAHKLLK